jgi:hypothetical protein
MSENASRKGPGLASIVAVGFKRGEALSGFLPQGGRGFDDVDFSETFDMRHAPIKRFDQFTQMTLCSGTVTLGDCGFVSH